LEFISDFVIRISNFGLVEVFMSRVRPSQPLVPSVLDRLLDDDPDTTREPLASRNQVMRDLKMAVCRDLENLLNTRVRCMTLPAHYKELQQSLVNYGIPDITGASLGTSQDREAFCRLLQTIIRQYEPRFKTVTVKPTVNTEPQDRTFRFRIDALLMAEPAPEPIVFDSELRPGTGDFAVKGTTHE
jgi:type VI secretion system protein ImpF